ncbi:hypothetical protein CTEN210_07585 [Chaetoceros tenuissimus]|uniref:Cystatin domain-containing protein n=1 Tax=Chaetoceros tenuissimus TaxID=426638 RepID=A0AAD3H5W9_9STRA|nr:hypothetical protein CTEN210_07585 [Chaetoceros tenuissimus]
MTTAKFSCRKVFILLLALLGSLSVMSENNSVPNHQTQIRRRTQAVGGYTPANPRDPSVIEAAEVVVTKLKQGSGPIADYSFDFPVGNGTSGNFEIKILGASQQVVAGVNYKLQIGIYVGLTCIGGIDSIVYRDLQGNYTVVSYGKELSCDDVKRLENGDSIKDLE